MLAAAAPLPVSLPNTHTHALRASGAVSLAAAGNEGFSRGPWLFSVSHPAALPGVVAVAHLRNSANPGQLLQLDRPIETPTGQRDVLVGIQRADTKRSLSDIPLPKQLVLLKTTSLAEGCFPLATVTSTTDISNKIFVLQVTPDCNSYALRDSLAMWQQIRFSRPWLVLFALPTDEAASFSGVMTNNGDVPVIWLAAEDAAALVGVMTADLTTPISLKALPGATVQALPVEAAKLPADSSSMGPTFDLRIKPDVAGPGTLYSSVPNDGYETYAGTSMATPYISGVVALWLQKQRPLWAGSGKQPLGSWPLAAATAIKTTAKPVVYPGTTLVYPPLKVGAGTVQALSAAQSRVFVTPTELLVQTNKASQAFTLTVTNTGDEAVTYTLGHTPAVSVSLPKAWYKQAYDLDAPVARLTFVPATLTVPAGSAAQVKVTVATPSFMNNLDLIYSGYVTLTPPDAASGDATLSDYSDEPAGNATGSDPSATATSPPIILSVAYQGTSKDYSTFTARSLAFLPTPLPELDPVTANALKARGVAYVCADYFYNPGAPDSVSACNYEGGMIKSYKQTDRLMFAVSVLRPVASYTILVYNANGKTLLGTSRSGSDDVIITASPPLSRSFTAPWDGSFDAVSGGVQYLEVRKTYRFKLALFAPLAAADKQAGRQPSNRPFTVDVAGAVAIQPLG